MQKNTTQNYKNRKSMNSVTAPVKALTIFTCLYHKQAASMFYKKCNIYKSNFMK
jgi:hypothetical protein